MAHDVFISYSSKNKTTSDAICHALEQHEIKCWIAPRDIVGGEKYGDVIEAAIKSCKVFVIIFSEESRYSPWVESELNIAFTDRKIIIPFKIDKSVLEGEMRLILNNKHWIEAYPNPEKEFGTLLKSIEKLIIYKTGENIKNRNVDDSIEKSRINNPSYEKNSQESKFEKKNDSKLIIEEYPEINLLPISSVGFKYKTSVKQDIIFIFSSVLITFIFIAIIGFPDNPFLINFMWLPICTLYFIGYYNYTKKKRDILNSIDYIEESSSELKRIFKKNKFGLYFLKNMEYYLFPNYEYIQYLGFGLWGIKDSNSKWGIFSQIEKRVLIDPKFDIIEIYKEKKAKAILKDKVYYIDSKGHLI